MADVTQDAVIGHGMEAAKLALEYVMNLVADPFNATEDEQRAVVWAIAACIAALNTKLLTQCNQDVYRESQDMIIRFMEAGSQGIKRALTTPEKEDT